MTDYRPHIVAAAQRYGVPPALALAVMHQESRGRQSAVSPKGATGLMQLMPATARELGVDRLDPMQNIDGGVRYLAQQLKRFGTVPLALAAYNAGPGRVQQYKGIPPWDETQNYVKTIMGNYQRATGLLGADSAAPAARAPAARAPAAPAGSGYVPAEPVRGLLDYQPASDVDAMLREMLPLTTTGEY
jgi:soluble lytic murein transglycosylase-like protein